MNSYTLLKELCSVHAPSGDESALTSFIYQYVQKHSNSWRKRPQVFSGPGFQDTIILVFGNPRVAAFAHIDSVGFMVGYEKELLPIGTPKAEEGTQLVGRDALGEICCTFHISEKECTDDDGNILYTKNYEYSFNRDIERGTTLTFKPKFVEEEPYIISNYLDNRAGVWTLLKLAESIEHGALVFTTWEEHRGGSVQFLQRFLYKKYHIRQALIADITWVTKGIKHGDGCVISMRDSYIPRRTYVNRIIDIIKRARMSFQLEVESSGGSDGGYIQQTQYAIDWCFIGAPQAFSHTPNEKIHKADLDSMLDMYRILFKDL